MAAIDQQSIRREMKYVRKFSLDIAQGQLAQDFGFGPSGGIEAFLSDVLGDHQYYFLLSNNATSRSNLLTSFNVALTRLDLTRQLNVAYGGFHFVDRFLDRFDDRFQERRFGIFTALSYPFSKFERLETSLVISNSDRQPFYLSGRSRRTSFLVSNAIGYTKDNSLWGAVGPIDGERYNIGIEWTVDFLRSRLWVVTPIVDYRRYTRLSLRSALALRLMGRLSFGQEPYDFAIGGSWTLRGYRWRSLWGNHFLLLNTELRFPLIDNLWIGFPIGGIGFSAFRGALFFDVGNAWRSSFGRPEGSLGAGIRLALSPFLTVRFDVAKKTDFRRIEPGFSRDFFFGWDF
jgi:outer membrane protein assembly factor BamA